MGLFGKLGSLFGGSSEDKEKSAQAPAKVPNPNATPEELLADYIAEKIPKEYPKASCYDCTITTVDKGHYGVTLHLELANAEQSDQDTLELTELETGYLMSEVFQEPPYPTDFTLIYHKEGKEFATVVKPHRVKVCIRIYNGVTDHF